MLTAHGCGSVGRSALVTGRSPCWGKPLDLGWLGESCGAGSVGAPMTVGVPGGRSPGRAMSLTGWSIGLGVPDGAVMVVGAGVGWRGWWFRRTYRAAPASAVSGAAGAAASAARATSADAVRPAAASLALQAGADLKVVQDQLGHSSIVFIDDTYVTVPPDVTRKSAENVARLVLDAARRAPGSHRRRRRTSPPTKSAGPPHQHPSQALKRTPGTGHTMAPTLPPPRRSPTRASRRNHRSEVVGRLGLEPRTRTRSGANQSL